MDRSSIVGQNVYFAMEAGEDNPRPFFVDAYIGQAGEGGPHYYRCTRDGQTAIIPADLLRVMTHTGLERLDFSRPGDTGLAATDPIVTPEEYAGLAHAGSGAVPRPFEQVGKAGAVPVPAMSGATGLATPAVGTDEGERFRRFLAWEATQSSYPTGNDLPAPDAGLPLGRGTQSPMERGENLPAHVFGPPPGQAAQSPMDRAENRPPVVPVARRAAPYPVRETAESDDEYHARVRAWETEENRRVGYSGAQDSDETDVSEHQV